MDDEQIKRWADQFTADLRVGGEPIPLDRVIARHLKAFADLRAKGLTWRVISNILTRAGARRASGSPIGADHLRADVSRLSRQQRRSSAPRRQAVGGGGPAPPRIAERGIPAASVRKPSGDAATSTCPSRPPGEGGEKDLTDAELASALAKIRNRKG